jgi:hypothetical protein
LGWSNVNDANQELVNRFKRYVQEIEIFAQRLGQSQITNLQFFEAAAISTLDPEWPKRFVSENAKIAKEVLVEGRTLRSILDDFEPSNRIDLLVINAEGSDLQVLQSLAMDTLIKSRFPNWLLLEAAPPVSNALQTPAVKLAIQFGYKPHMVLAMSTLLKYVG